MATAKPYVNIFSSLKVKHHSQSHFPTNSSPFFPSPSILFSGEHLNFRSNFHNPTYIRRKPLAAATIMLPENPVTRDFCAFLLSAAIARATLAVWELTAKFNVFDSKLNRKLVHTSIGIVFMLCWPLFSSGYRGAFLACLVPGVNAIRVLLIGLGIYKDESVVNSMSRFGDYRELLKGPLYYASTIAFACLIFWRTSPIGIAAICNLCAGDGLADIVGRRFGAQKLPYNKNKSYAGSIAMAIAGFVASVGFMHYFSLFEFMQESWGLVFRFFIVSLISSLVESLPISTEIDDNLTVPLASILAGGFLF